MYQDIRNKAIELDTYVNDEQIGSFVENNIGTKQYSTEVLGDDYGVSTGKYDVKTEIGDLTKTGDYVDTGTGSVRFTGENTFKADPTVKKKGFDYKKAASSISKGLLTPTNKTDALPYYMGSQDMTMQTATGGYTGTDIQGSGGGSLLKGVFSDDERQRIMSYYKNMNLIGSS